MSEISFTQKGDFRKVDGFFEKMKEYCKLGFLDKYGREGVRALSQHTPIETGETSKSWKYEIKREGTITSLEFHNTHINQGVNIAVILQYGHGTRTGGWVEGTDYINPALEPIFKKILEEALKEVR